MKKKQKNPNDDFQQALLSPENDYRLDNYEILRYDIEDNFQYEIDGTTYYIDPKDNPYTLNKQFNDFLSKHEKEYCNVNYKRLQLELKDEYVFPKRILRSEIVKINEYKKLQEYLLLQRTRKQQLAITQKDNDMSIDIFRLQAFHPDTYLADAVTPNPLSTNSIKKIQTKVQKFDFKGSIGYEHTGSHWISLIIDGDRVQQVDPFNPKYNSPDGSVVTGVKQSDSVSCSLFALINNALFLNKVNAIEVDLKTSDVQMMKLAISYKSNDLSYNRRAKIILQNFGDRILVKGLIKKVQASTLQNKGDILQELNEYYNSLVNGCQFKSSVKDVTKCFNTNIDNTRLLNEAELLNMFKLNLELQQAKQTEEVAKPRLTIPQNNNDAEVKSRVQFINEALKGKESENVFTKVKTAPLKEKEPENFVTKVKNAMTDLVKKFNPNVKPASNEDAKEYIESLRSNIEDNKKFEKQKTPEELILESLSQKEYGKFLSKSTETFKSNSKDSKLNKEDLIVFTGSDEEFNKFIKDVMPVYEDIIKGVESKTEHQRGSMPIAIK